MKKYFYQVISVLSIAMAPTLAHADESSESERNWAATAEVGYIMTGGNTDTQQLNAKFAGALTRGAWGHAINLEALTASESDETNAERYLAAWQTDYALTPKSYIFFDIKHDVDRFSGFDYQTTMAAGYGLNLLNTDTMKWDFEIGPGYRVSELKETGENEEDAVLHINTLYDWAITETSSLTQELTVDTSSDSTISRSVTALVSQVASSLAMKLTYTMKHQTDVPDDIEELDRELGLTLVYSF